MKKMLKIELSRALKNKFLLISIGIGSLITLLQYFQVVIPNSFLGNIDFFKEKYMLYPNSLFLCWFGGNGPNILKTVFYMLLPLLATLPFADSFFTDKKSGYIKNVFVRTEKKYYYLSKFIAVFISGGIAVTAPLVLNFFLSALTLPALMPQSSVGFYGVSASSLWSGIFYTHPYLFVLLYFLLDFIFAGLLACVAPAVSYFAEHRFEVLLAPFVLYLCLYFLFGLTGNYQYDPSGFLRPDMGHRVTFAIVAGETVVLAAVTAGTFFIKGFKNETY